MRQLARIAVVSRTPCTAGPAHMSKPVRFSDGPVAHHPVVHKEHSDKPRTAVLRNAS